MRGTGWQGGGEGGRRREGGRRGEGGGEGRGGEVRRGEGRGRGETGGGDKGKEGRRMVGKRGEGRRKGNLFVLDVYTSYLKATLRQETECSLQQLNGALSFYVSVS